MPYKVAKHGNQYCVEKEATGEKMGCHDTQQEADQQMAALYANERTLPETHPMVAPARSIVVRMDDVIEGYICIFGEPGQTDSYGTYFDPADLPPMDLEFLPKPLRYEHGFDPEVGKDPVGKVVKVWKDNVGIAFQGILDKTHQAYTRIKDELKKGILGTSSGSSDYLAEFDESGRFSYWPVNELSLTASPAEERIPRAAIIRSNNRNFIKVSNAPNGTAEDETRSRGEKPTSASLNKPKGAKRTMPFTLEQLGIDATATPQDFVKALKDALGEPAAMALLQSLVSGSPAPAEPAAGGDMPMDAMSSTLSAPAAAPAAAPTMSDFAAILSKLQPVKTEGDGIDALRRELTALKQQMMTAEAPKDETIRSGAKGSIIENVVDRRYDYSSTRGLTWALNVLQATNKPISGSMLRALMYKVKREEEAGDKAANEFDVRSASPIRKASDVDSISFPRSFRANEVDNTAATAKGIEWVGTKYETDLWLTVRQATIWEQFKSKGMMEKAVPRGFASDIIPIEGADLTWYTTGETTTVDATNRPNVAVTISNVGTGKQTVTVKKLTAAAAYSGELDEDSLIPVADEFDRKMRVQAQEQIEYVLLNGDTDTTLNTNINLIDGTPAAGVNYLLGNGMLKLALVTSASTNSRDGGALDKLDYRILLGKMGVNGIAGNDPTKLIYVVDIPTYLNTLDLPELATKDVSSFATIENGYLTNIYGVNLFRSGQMALANTAGKISTTGSNNTKGRILLVRPDQWALAFKRQITTEVERFAMSDATVIVTAFRLGWIYRNALTAAAVSYNLTVL